MITEFFINIAINLISTIGYPGIFLLMTAESMAIPFPSEITMGFSGFLVTQGQMSLPMAVATGTIGNVTGATIAYYIGYHFKKLVIKKFIKKYGKFIFIKEEEFGIAKVFLKNHGVWIITISRFIPGLRTVVSFPAGAAQIPFTKFIAFTALGSLLWVSTITFTGASIGSNWKIVLSLIHKFDTAILLLLIMIVGIYIYKKFNRP